MITTASGTTQTSPPTFDRVRRIGGELEFFAVRREAGRYRPALLTEQIFRQGPELPVPPAGHLSREFHRDMIELNPGPCLTLQEHYQKLRVLLAEARTRVAEIAPGTVLVGLALNPLKEDPAIRTSLDPVRYARTHVFPDPRYQRFLDTYREYGDLELREFLSMGLMISYQAELSLPRGALGQHFHLSRNLVPLMVAISCNSPNLDGARRTGGPRLAGRIALYRRNCAHGRQPFGIPETIPETFDDYLAGLDHLPERFDLGDPRTRLSLDYRWVRLNMPTSVIVEPREIDTQPTLLENVALQAAQLGIVGGQHDSPVLDLILSASPSHLEKSLGSAADSGLEGTFYHPGGQRPLVALWEELLELAERRLAQRGLGEEHFLKPLFWRVERKLTPAQLFVDFARARGLNGALDVFVDCLQNDRPVS